MRASAWPRVALEAGVVDARDLGVAGEVGGDGLGAVAVRLHPDRERLHAAEHEKSPAARGRPPPRSGGTQALGQRRVARRPPAPHHVAVPAEVLRGAVDDEVGSERERGLEVGRRERVVDGGQRAAARASLRARGHVDDLEIGFTASPTRGGASGGSRAACAVSLSVPRRGRRRQIPTARRMRRGVGRCRRRRRPRRGHGRPPLRARRTGSRGRAEPRPKAIACAPPRGRRGSLERRPRRVPARA